MGDGGAFFGYPARPPHRLETICRAVELIRADPKVRVVTWQDLEVSGRVIIDAILRAIRDADVSCFEITDPNQNVLFELGFAIGADRRVWIIRDPSVDKGQRSWDELRTLTTVGYHGYYNSEDIAAGFRRDRPDQRPSTIFQESIRASLPPKEENAIFSIRPPYEHEADRMLARRLGQEERRGARLIVADPAEAAVYPLHWYAQQITRSKAVIAHFSSPDRRNARTHNARCALVCGMTVGMGVPLLMLAEEDYVSPIDYRNFLFIYPTGEACVRRVDEWLRAQAASAPPVAVAEPTAQPVEVGGPTASLRTLSLGEYVAENERDGLSQYFIETAPYKRILESETTVFVGRRGTGKTANLIRAAEVLKRDVRNLVVVIKPVAYDIQGILSLLGQVQDQATKGYLIEALWKYLLLSEVAVAAVDDIRTRHPWVDPRSPEGELVAFVEGQGDRFHEDFAVRLEEAVKTVSALRVVDGVKERRASISEALHGGMLRELRTRLGAALKDRERVAILVDNLDKAWRRGEDIDALSGFLLGLLTSIGSVARDFEKQDYWRDRVKLTLAVFVRSDIYGRVAKLAREPDKIPQTRIVWTDVELLLRVVEERFRVSSGRSGVRIWSEFFCRTVRGEPTPQYLAARVMPRPRDILYWCSAAIANAVNRGHLLVEEADVLDAEKSYSQFALESIQVENGVTLDEMQASLYEFLGGKALLSRSDVLAAIRRAVPDDDKAAATLDHLVTSFFLGVRTGPECYEYYQTPEQGLKIAKLGERAAKNTGTEIEYSVHPAFRSFLEIGE